MPSLKDLQAQYDHLQAAIAATPPADRASLHYASGLLIEDIKSYTAACSECQAGRCCGHCWCCYDRDRRALELALTAENAPAAEWQRFSPPAEQCSFCTRPADPTLKTADWPMCTACFNEMGAFDPVLDGAALEIAEAILQPA